MDRRQRGHARRRRHPYAMPPAPVVRTPECSRLPPEAARPAASCDPLQNVATWTVTSGQTSVGWVSRLPTEDQPAIQRALPAPEVPEPLRVLTLENRYRTEPCVVYAEDERRLLCALCGVPEIHRSTHLARSLRAEHTAAKLARCRPPTNAEAVTEAVLVLQNLRSDLLARNQAPGARSF
ncbi:hypothetical protein MTO96_028611 [Rhipicephalus appendiculatus]